MSLNKVFIFDMTNNIPFCIKYQLTMYKELYKCEKNKKY